MRRARSMARLACDAGNGALRFKMRGGCGDPGVATETALRIGALHLFSEGIVEPLGRQPAVAGSDVELAGPGIKTDVTLKPFAIALVDIRFDRVPLSRRPR